MLIFSRAREFVRRYFRNSSAEFRKEWQNIKLNLSWFSNRTLTTDILTISLTKRCNLNCTYCWDFDQRPKLNELETDDIKKLLVSAKKLGVRSFNPFGGEPFIRKDAVEIIEFAFSLGFVVSVTTNGTLLTDEKLRRLVECVPRNGELVVLISLDGSSAEENDYIRDPGSFEKTTRTIRKLNELRHELARPVGLVVNTVVSRNNFRSMVRQVHLVQELGADQVHFITPIVNGGVVANGMVKRNLFIFPDEFPELDQQIDAVLELKKNSGDRPLVLNNASSLEHFKGFYRRQFEHHELLISSNQASKKIATLTQAEVP